MTIYIDSEYKCHPSGDGSMRAFELPFFEGKCDAFIEGYRYVPEGETWTRPDGEEFPGGMTAPWKDYTGLYLAQLEYELSLARAEISDMGAALEAQGVDGDA